MITYKFLITLKDGRTKKYENIKYESIAGDYLNAWKEACEQAWAELNDHDKYWYIDSIRHYL